MDVLCVGETLTDIITRPVSSVSLNNDSTSVQEILFRTGGDALNNAVDLSVIGNSVAYAGRIGSDMCGDYILDTCKKAGVDMSHVVRSDTPHGKMNILIDQQGNRAFFYYPGVSAEFTIADVDSSLLRQCRVLQLGSTFHLPNFDGANGAASLLKMAQEIGVITSMDVTKDPTGRWNEILSPCYPYLDYFLPSEEQAMLLAGTEDVEAMADFFLEGGVKCVVIKLGSRGCFCKTAQLSFYCGCYDVPVVETTGAGDAFVAGFLSGVLRNGSMEDCVRLGTAASAHVIQCVGANTGIRDLKTLLAFIGTHPLEIRYTGK